MNDRNDFGAVDDFGLECAAFERYDGGGNSIPASADVRACASAMVHELGWREGMWEGGAALDEARVVEQLHGGECRNAFQKHAGSLQQDVTTRYRHQMI